ncbi:unnamed protein product [Anisakis simplex]|uniref:non-specific serine/threonine protein kinase n=1 Tax=Anisakis simplex TaxID=6269 RepID=A0A3P6QK41_ANISI|nr:unnamed protein product [Anisakis simplex]
MRESLCAWTTFAGPSSLTVEDELERQFPEVTTQIVTNQSGAPCEADFTSVLNDLFADGNRLFQPLTDNDFVDEVFAEKKPKILNGYLFGDTIGEGSYGKVKEVLEECTLVRRAVKIIKAARLRKIPNGRANVEQELRILQRVHHRNVIALRDVFRHERKQKLYMVMDYCTGSLQQMLDCSNEKKLPIFQAHHYFTQLTDGLSYLHGQGVIHKDIKPGNLLVTLNDILKISDFGVAEMLDRYSSEDWCTIAQGTPKFQPPEIVSGTVERYHGRKVDIWACGVTLYNLVSGEYPFEGDIIMRLFDNIATQPLQMPKSVHLSESLQNLLSAMLEKDPDHRINMHDIRRCDWFKQKFIHDERLRVAVPVCNNMPAHRPLSVYAPLEQMFGNSMESDDGDGDNIERLNLLAEGDDDPSCSNFHSSTENFFDNHQRTQQRLNSYPSTSQQQQNEFLTPSIQSDRQSSTNNNHNNNSNNNDAVPLNESKRNRSILSMCMGSSRSP